ncbi:hypothetical protein [uncultured Nocardioides sp.]|uniref:hypothetical protein n=1 Tax=uncultured Nocardioides sp. TaxID=198441 RepID=UPI002639BF6A|nr:hypothetical protein [uncultured Nocardioides sp.]
MTQLQTVPISSDVPAVAAPAERMTVLVDQDLIERVLTAAVRDELEATLAAGLELPKHLTRPDPGRYVMYPLHVFADGRLSIASAV